MYSTVFIRSKISSIYFCHLLLLTIIKNYNSYFYSNESACSGTPFYSEINSIGLCYSAINGTNQASGFSISSSIAATSSISTYDLRFTVYNTSSTCSGNSFLYPTTGPVTLTVGACAAPNEDYLQYGVYRYPKAFSSQLSSVVIGSSPPTSTAKGVALNFYRKSSDCAAGFPIANQVNIASDTCMPNPSQTNAANSGTTQYYTILQVTLILYYQSNLIFTS